MRRVIGAAAALLLCGCAAQAPEAGTNQSPSNETTTASSDVSPSSAQSSTASGGAEESFPPPPEGETADQAAIRGGWQEYWRVLEHYTADPAANTDPAQAQAVTTGEMSSGILDIVEEYRANGWQSQGGLVFRDVHVGEPETSEEGRMAVVSYCLDSSRHVVVKDGNPVDAPGPVYAHEAATMVEGADGVWRLAHFGTEETSSC